MKIAANELPERVLVIGFARTGQSVARVLAGRGVAVRAFDDQVNQAMDHSARALGVELHGAGDRALAELVAGSDLVVVSPGVPPSHPVFSLVDRQRIVSEIELAYLLLDVPVVAITGTNGKTTVTELVAAMLERSGIRARALGNIGVPLIEAVLDDSLELAVAEVSSFQLLLTQRFAPVVGTWLNLAEDHLDWHADLDEYAAAKARIWAAQRPGDVAVANLDDPIVIEAGANVTARLVTFGERSGDYHAEGGALIGPEGKVASRDDLVRTLPHDVMNVLAAIATAISAGGDADGCVAALHDQRIPPHRVEFVTEVEGVSFYDDSKATTPSAVMAALSGFSSAVLIAGGRNKGLDLAAIRRYCDEQSRRVKAVVAIGESQDELVAAFAPDYRVEVAASMDEAVALAAGHAEGGDAVLLSPGCASFDWYHSYEERGEDFKRARAGAGSQVTTAKKAPPVRLHEVNRGEPRFDAGRRDARRLVALAAVLSGFGLVIVLSASSVLSTTNYGSPWSLFERQVLWTVLGLAAALICVRLDLQKMRRFIVPVLVFCSLLLVAVLVPAIGKVSGGSSRWIGAGPIRIQPSELTKLAFALFCADLIARREQAKDQAHEIVKPVIFVLSFFALLIIKQPDLGTAIVLICIACSVLYVGGVRSRLLAAVLGLVCLAGTILSLSAPYRRARLLSFINPFGHASTTGYQIVQSLAALGSGHLTGIGLGGSSTTWGLLPNAQTDFIFAVIGNELGLVGAVLVLLAFATFGWLGIRVAMRSKDRFSSLLATGLTCWIVSQAFINVGGVIGVLPDTGIPLPFISSGGSSLVVALSAVGLLVNIARHPLSVKMTVATRAARGSTKGRARRRRPPVTPRARELSAAAGGSRR